MSCNIANEYITFAQKSIKKYLQTILDHQFDQDIYDDLINAYTKTRYYNDNPKMHDKPEINIIYYLAQSIKYITEENSNYQKSMYMLDLFKYILYFDKVCECPSVRPFISLIEKFREEKLNIKDKEFEGKFYDLLKSHLIAQTEFLESFNDKHFNVEYKKIKDQIFNTTLKHNIKFSKIYSQYALDKVFNNKVISEQKIFITYSMVCTKIIQDIIKSNFNKVYLIDYPTSLKEKPTKQKRLLNIIDNDIVKEKLALKINYQDYLQDKEEIYNLTREGYNIALILPKDYILDEGQEEILKIFKYVITDNPEIKKYIDEEKILNIPK